MSPPDAELVSFKLCPYAQRTIIVMTEKAVAHRRTYIELSDKPAWFERISPVGKVPLLRIGDAVLFESAVICEYLEETTTAPLHPSDPLERAGHRAWIEFGSSMLDAIAGLYTAPDAPAFARRRETLEHRLDWLERHLGEGPYFAGERFHLVDAVYPTVFRYFDAFDRVEGLDLASGRPRVAAYRAALAARESVRSAVVDAYPELLWQFLERRGSHLSSLIGGRAAA